MTTNTGSATFEHVIGPTGRFQLRQFSGDISIRGCDGDVVVVRERTGKSITDSFQVEAGSGSLSLAAPGKFGVDLMIFGVGRRSSLDLEVDVPRRANVTVETASAEVEAHGLLGGIRVRTASGDVNLTDLAGGVELDAVSGDARVSASGPLDLRARTISGDLLVRAPRLDRSSIETTSGEVRVDALLAGPGPFSIQTVSGDATVVGRAGIRIEARTITGDIRTDLPHRRESGPGRKAVVVGDGATTLTFKSVSGDLRVVAGRDDLPKVPSAPRDATVAATADPAERPGAASPSPAPAAAETLAQDAGHEVSRLDLLRALERGDLSVEAAMARLAEIDEA